ncbi:peptidoglycan D,D-transpeptidase FtsI family protein [Clostridium uliginosum]|uniref:Cell division protein FtsI/penicillin-binding protein 2 n=1 Tax=Clostridium uliginosum TaxID=119641 RepID=A0A1I1QIV5_9CLOT|nr:penicillin-binding transpeptidase domain-containing protein [Clostridium uliginosum]SFD21975.1 Cell division protein FtsI/penicillin-binding protein 2 [Clostridium uliginosum]
MKDISDSVKKVMIVFLFCFVALISYIAYFQVFKAPGIAEQQGNKRLWAEQNKVLRGTIYDRNQNALTKSERKDALTQKREYVYGDLYTHVLGYVDPVYKNAGLEATYAKELTTNSSSSNDLLSLIKDFSFDKFKDMFDNRKQEENKVGNSIITTLDAKIQKTAYDALGNNKGAVVVLNPQTGEVLAMVSKPTYNPNDLEAAMKAANSGSADNTPLINRATAGLYPPGSTFKTVTLTSSLENISGITTRTFQDDGKLVFNAKQSLSNSGGAAYGSLNLKDAFKVSSNVVFGGLAMELGNDKLKQTAEKFGFNNTIEANGFTIQKSQFPTLKSGEVGSIAQTGIGQSSILATPMQMALVTSTIANNGVMMEPKLVNKVIDKDGKTVKTIGTKTIKQVMPSSDAATIKDYMKNLVDSKLNSSWGFFQGTDTCGKTGTADYKLANGQDATPHSWFIGFAPQNNPQVAVAVIVENGGYGAVAAAQVAGRVIQTSLSK